MVKSSIILNSDTLYSYDIILSAFISAFHSYRKDKILCPFPKDYIYNGEKNYDQLGKHIAMIPPLIELLKENYKIYDKIQMLIFSIINMNTFNIKLCQNNEFNNIKKITKQHFNAPIPQFIFKLIYQEQIFVLNCSKKLYAYHGSSLDNLYSILSNGLSSQFSRDGLFGDGIYLSSELSMVLNYSRRGKSWEKSIMGPYISFVLVCEIYDNNSSDLKYSNDKSTPDSYFIVKDCSLVKIKYVLIYRYPDQYSESMSNLLPLRIAPSQPHLISLRKMIKNHLHLIQIHFVI
ncbi:unnamed protein product [Gordionus sp. m RMFG-2023]|uniref:protein mono-ADP-ribosyltransferase PARP16-like isoform X2 n=1 Tax=Gordionus sp. m RMFG-2023 TaxID=3053472 RepID=UPI0030E1C987